MWSYPLYHRIHTENVSITGWGQWERANSVGWKNRGQRREGEMLLCFGLWSLVKGQTCLAYQKLLLLYWWMYLSPLGGSMIYSFCFYKDKACFSSALRNLLVTPGLTPLPHCCEHPGNPGDWGDPELFWEDALCLSPSAMTENQCCLIQCSCIYNILVLIPQVTK